VRAGGGAVLESQGRDEKRRFPVALEEDQEESLQPAADEKVPFDYGS